MTYEPVLQVLPTLGSATDTGVSCIIYIISIIEPVLLSVPHFVSSLGPFYTDVFLNFKFTVRYYFPYFYRFCIIQTHGQYCRRLFFVFF